MRAKEFHELLRARDNDHSILAPEAHIKHIQFRGESRYLGFSSGLKGLRRMPWHPKAPGRFSLEAPASSQPLEPPASCQRKLRCQRSSHRRNGPSRKSGTRPDRPSGFLVDRCACQSRHRGWHER